jgi:hypothetical protein
MSRTSLVCVIVLAITAAAAAPVPDQAAAPDAKRLAELGADSATPRGAVKLFVLALKHQFGIRMADLVAPAGEDDENFIADHDALTAAITRLRTESDQRFGDETQRVGHKILAQPTDEQLRALFAQVDESIPRDAKGDTVKLGADAAKFYAGSAVRGRDGKWKIALLPQVTAPLIALAEFGDVRAFTAAVGELGDGVAKRRLNGPGELDAGLAAATRARSETIAAALDLQGLQGKWERKPVGEELDGNVVARVVGTVNGVHLTTTYLNRDGKVHMALRARMTPSLTGNVRVMTFSDLHHPPGETNFGYERKGYWRKSLYALRGDTWTEGMGFLEDDKGGVGVIEWTRLAEKPETPKQAGGKPE